MTAMSQVAISQAPSIYNFKTRTEGKFCRRELHDKLGNRNILSEMIKMKKRFFKNGIPGK